MRTSGTLRRIRLAIARRVCPITAPSVVTVPVAIKPPEVRRDVWYDYRNQAWVANGLYQDCAHAQNHPTCACYGRAHAGEVANPDNRRTS